MEYEIETVVIHGVTRGLYGNERLNIRIRLWAKFCSNYDGSTMENNGDNLAFCGT